MELNHSLPFSDIQFFYFLGAAVLFMFLGKLVSGQKIAYKWLLLVLNIAYISLLFTKPLEILIMILVLYLMVLGLRKWYSKDKILFPMLLLALPVFIMKSMVFFPMEGQTDFIAEVRRIIQIAGLSYMVFKVIGLYIDERKTPGNISFLSFFNFTAFVPTLLIGPIDRFKRFNTDVNNGYAQMNATYLAKGWNNFILGVLYKFIIAEAIRRVFMVNLEDDGSLVYHISYMYTYLLYLFFDFAGYSLLAISFGNFIGIDVPINFDKPFLSVNPKEFWKRWHKSLGDWLGDYFFKPIFKDLTTRKVFTSITRQNIALFMTFTLMGFWNGFELHYIASGMLFGLYSVGHNYYVYRCKKGKRDVVFGNLKPEMVRYISIFIMFNLTAFAIYIFSGKLF